MSTTPTSPKVIASTIAAPVAVAATTVVVWIVEETAHIDVPAGVEAAAAIVLAAAGAFIAGYVRRDPLRVESARHAAS